VASDVAPWRRGSTQGPLIFQVLLTARNPDDDLLGDEGEVVLEEWALEFGPEPEVSPGREPAPPRRQAAQMDTHAVYKRLVIFHRSLHSYVRILPAFRVFRTLKRNPDVPYNIVHRIVASATMAQDRSTGSFRFGAVETPKGTFQASVTYRSCSILPELERSQLATLSSGTSIIPDYIMAPPQHSGQSPSAALRRCVTMPLESSQGRGASKELGGRVQSVPRSERGWRDGAAGPEGALSAARPPQRCAPGKQSALEPSPRSALHPPPSQPSSDPSSGAGGSPSCGWPHPGPAPGPERKDAVDQQAGFQPRALGQQPSASVKGIKLTQGGISAAAIGGRMEPQGPIAGDGSHRPERHNADGAPRSIGWPSAGELGSERRQPGEGAVAAAHSNPVSIPRGNMPRNSSLSQLTCQITEAWKGAGAAAMGGEQQHGVSGRDALSAPSRNFMAPFGAPKPEDAAPQGRSGGDGGHRTKEAGTVGVDAGTSLESASSAASQCGMSCSPQLPFAFTPSSQSSSLLHRAGAALMEAHNLARETRRACVAGAGGPAGMSTSPYYQPQPSAPSSSDGSSNNTAAGVSCRDVSDLALIRRSSWSARSFLQDPQLPWEGSSSPSTNTMDVSQNTLTGTSAVQHSPALGGTPSPGNTHFAEQEKGFMLDADLSLEPEEEEDALPFALEDYQPDAPLGDADAGTAFRQDGAASFSDAAVGALARMLQEAPSLRSGCVSDHGERAAPDLDALLGDIEGLRYRLSMMQQGSG